MALRQLAHGITAFRDPGEWMEMHEPLRRRIAEERLPGPRLFLTGPHIDGERPAYPADSFVARDPDEARRQVHRAIDEGATAIKIYFRLPLASALAVIEACRARGVPSTAHLEILDARDLIEAGLTGIEHITSFGTSIASPMQAERYRQAVLADNGARRDGRYALFAEADLDGPGGTTAVRHRGAHAPVRGRDAGGLRGPGDRRRAEGQHADRRRSVPRASRRCRRSCGACTSTARAS